MNTSHFYWQGIQSDIWQKNEKEDTLLQRTCLMKTFDKLKKPKILPGVEDLKDM